MPNAERTKVALMSQQRLRGSSENTKQWIARRESRSDSVQSFHRDFHSPIRQLQQLLGNRLVAQLIQSRHLKRDGKIVSLQRKLPVGAADDRYEQEADRVVLSMGDAEVANSMQRARETQETKDKTLQPKPLVDNLVTQHVLQRSVHSLVGQAGNRIETAVPICLDRLRIQRQVEGSESVLSIGSSGPSVRALQERLVAAGAAIGIDGLFGPLTREAVQTFQESVGLTADGIVGPRTWQALDADTAAVPTGRTRKAAYLSLLAKLQTAISGLHTLSVSRPVGPTSSAHPTPAPGLGFTEEDESQDGLRSFTEAAEEAWGIATPAAEEAWGAVSETVEEAWGIATAGAEEAWGAISGTAEEAWGIVTSKAEEAWHGVEDTMGKVRGALDDLGDVRDRYLKEIATLDDVVREMGKGMQLGDEEIDQLDRLIDKVIDGLPIGSAVSAERADFRKLVPACVRELEKSDINIRQETFKVDATGLNDLKNKIVGRLGNNTLGHVKLDGMPKLKITCLGNDGTIFPGGVKITATGKASIP